MGTWHKTGCVPCVQNCGLEILVENDRITRPLKKVDGAFVPISWEEATTEIAEKLRATLEAHGSRSADDPVNSGLLD